MKLTDEIVQQIIETKDVQTIYQNYTTFMLQYEALKKHYDEIRYGIKQFFDIHDIFDGFVLIKPKNAKVSIRGKTIPLFEYRTEIEQRTALAKKLILDHITEKNEIYKPME